MHTKDVILEKYQVRKSKKQKLAFIKYVAELCEQEGIHCDVETDGGLLKKRNIVMGDVDNAELVITAHYDTCAVMPIPNLITPRNFFFFLFYQILLCVLMFAVAGGLTAAAFYLSDSAQIASLTWALSLLAICFLMMAGPANKHTANDNTSGVVTVLETMLSMPAEQRAYVAFVLFDLEEMGLFGSSAFNRRHRKVMKDKPLINLDCVSDGDNLLVTVPKKLLKEEYGKRLVACFEKSVEGTDKKIVATKRETTIYPSDQASFKNGIAVAALKRSWLIGLYMDRIHTPRDTQFDDRNIECIRNALNSFVSGE